MRPYNSNKEKRKEKRADTWVRPYEEVERDHERLEMDRPKISVVVITKNESDRIERLLKSVAWADEVIVVDDESTDNTRQICEEFGAKVIVNKLDGNFHLQRNLGIRNASGEWILQMDADEEVPPETAEEIRRAINAPGSFSAFMMLRKNFMFTHALRYGGAYNYVTKLFKRSEGCYSEKIHEVLNVSGDTGKIDAEIYHYPYSSIRGILDKMNFYTDAEAEKEIKERGDISLKEIKYRLTWKALKLFWKLYIKKQGYKDGIYGLIWSIINVIGPEIRWLKIWEKQIQVAGCRVQVAGGRVQDSSFPPKADPPPAGKPEP